MDGRMSLVLHKRDGTAKTWCRKCRCLHSGKACRFDKRREYVPGGVISMWNIEAYEAYENSPEGLAERRAWEREMLARVDEA